MLQVLLEAHEQLQDVLWQKLVRMGNIILRYPSEQVSLVLTPQSQINAGKAPPDIMMKTLGITIEVYKLYLMQVIVCLLLASLRISSSDAQNELQAQYPSHKHSHWDCISTCFKILEAY